jgi:hypothetical protein
MTNFIQGPWKLTETQSGIYLRGAKGAYITQWNFEHAGSYKLSKKEKEILVETRKANAHLISASPDMLYALIEIVNRFDPEGVDSGFDNARAAIAKAKMTQVINAKVYVDECGDPIDFRLDDYLRNKA